MTRVTRFTFLVTAAVLLSPASSGAQRHELGVYVQGTNGIGQGLTRARAGECFLVTPYHVLAPLPARGVDEQYGEAQLWDSVQVIGVRELRARGQHVASSSANDWAVVKLDIPAAHPLCGRWPGGSAVDAALRNSTTAAVIRRSDTGVLQQMRVHVHERDDRIIVLNTIDRGDSFQRGMSGSRVQIGPTVVAMLLQVDSSHAASAIRLDFLDGETGRYFRAPLPPPAPALAISVVLPGAAHLASQRRAAGISWLALTSAGTAGMVFYSRNATRVSGAVDYMGVWREYTYEVREHPLRSYALPLWLAGGTMSAIEAFAQIQMRRPDSPARARRGARVMPAVRPHERGGAEVSVGLTF